MEPALLRQRLAPLLALACWAASFLAPLHARAAERVQEFSIVQRRVAAAPPTFTVTQGDVAVLRWRSDEAVTLHLHGYDLPLAVAPGKPAAMRVEAKVLGRFPVTSHGFGAGKHGGHHREQPLAFLEVRPE